MKMLCSVQLSKNRYKTSEGYLVCKNSIIARTGPQTYLKSELYGESDDEDIYIDVDRKPEQVFDEKTMASFEGKPLTIEHPSESVSPENYKELSVGNVHNIHRGTFENQEVMYADITVYDAEAIDLIESGEMVELSCGYDCDITDGPNPEQINIRGNHVALCEQGRAGIARIQDSWGAKPVIKDSVQKGTLIQEFGRYGEQYKIVKIEGNVLYCEELTTHKNTLFKKDKENIDWAIINKSQVNDSIKDEEKISVEECSDCYGLTQEELNKIWKKINEDRSTDSLGQNSRRKKKLFVNQNEKKKFMESLPKEAEVMADEFDYVLEDEDGEPNKWLVYWEVYYWDPIIKDSKTCKRIVNGKEFENIEEASKLAKKLFEKGELKEYSEIWVDEMGYTHESDLKNMIKHAMKKDSINWSSWDIIISTDKPWHFTLNKIEKKIHDKYGYTLNEVKENAEKGKLMLQCIDLEYGNVGESQIQKMSIGPFNSKKEAERFANRELKQMLEQTADDESFDVDFKERQHSTNDSKTRYIITLSGGRDESTWLDKEDKPTTNINEARTFTTYEEADSHRKTYCKGSIQEIKDSVVKDIFNIPVEKKQIESILNSENINYDKIGDSWGSITIDFSDKKELRKAARMLTNLYDIELFDEDLDELYIAVYYKFDKPVNKSIEDSENWFGCNLLKGRPADDFKQYLRDRGLYFEPSENGNFIHFEIKNADEDVEKEIRAINNHYKKVGIFDDYGRKFYSKAIKLLNEKLEKLEKNELLDSNQEDYEIQKEHLRKEIKSQIEEYKNKMNEL